jgi:hypothetical protein
VQVKHWCSASGGERPGASSGAHGGFRRVSSSVMRANNAHGSGVRENDSARPEQARVRQQEKRSNCVGQRRTERRRAGWRHATHGGVPAGRA